MKVVKTDDLLGTERDVKGSGFKSIRIILERDNMGFSLHKTIIYPGKYNWHYKNHLESCYCVSGIGSIKDLETNEVHNVVEGTTYILDKNDNHEFEAKTTVVLISVFNPPVKGSEVHNKYGSYEV